MKEDNMKLSTKILIGLIFFIMFILGLGAWDIRQNNIKSISMGMPSAEAGILEDIGAAIGGHIDDVADRLKDDEFIPGDRIDNFEFTYSKDSIHYANGSGEIVVKDGKTYIQLNEDFSAGLAPDLYIFTSNKRITTQADVNRAEKMNLTKLKKGSGASYYEIDPKDVKSIVIWCKRFNQLMGSAIVK